MVRFQFSWTLLLAIVLGFVFYTSVGRRSLAQIPPQTPPVKEPSMIHAVDGASLFQSYCATCHGKDASGRGPAAAALKKSVPDLTQIAQRHGGAFPVDDVHLIISGEIVPSPAHGSREMPIWGPIFSQIEWDQDLGRVRIYNLAKYLETLQKK
jgi:mono/diheme cytochrome c family protein